MSEAEQKYLRKWSANKSKADRQLTEEEVDRINRYVDQCPRPLAGGGFKDTLTGEYIGEDEQ